MANKQQKPELVAIYRLEFYKKQKNWKFSNDFKPKSKSTKPKKLHNLTYNIEAESSDSPLNKGLIEEKQDIADDNTPTSDRDVPEKIVKETTSSPEDWQDTEQHINTNDAEIWKDAVCYDDYDCGVNLDEWFGDQAWNQQSTALLPTNQCTDLDQYLYNNICCNINEQIEKDEIDGPYHGSTSSIDSLTEFIRGAHIAPHSSELDVTDDACTCSDGDWSIPRMSSKQLEAGVNRHVKTLTMLLRETALRDRDKFQTPSLDLPTRDDWVGNEGNIGRGRGRLHNAHVIGIGMGRPFRLH